MKSFLRAAFLLFATVTFLATAFADTPAPASKTSEASAPDFDFGQDLLDIAAAQQAGKKDEAFKLNQALYEKLSSQLEFAQTRLGDLSLVRINPFAAIEKRQAANTAYPSVRDATKLIILNYGAFMQGQASFLKSIGKPVDDTVAGIGQSYQAILGIKTLLTAAMMMDNHLKGPDGKPLNAHLTFVQGIEAAARTNAAAPAPGVTKFYAEAKDKLPVTADLSAKVAKNLLHYLPAYLTVTADSLTAEELLTSVISVDSTNAALWAERCKIRLTLGELEGAYYDAIIALAIGGETPATIAARDAFQASPQYPSSVYQEPAIAIYKAQAGMVAFTGGALTPDSARAVRAAQRNRDRRLYACSFISDPAQRAPAIKWVLENNTEDTSLRGEVLGDKAKKFEEAYKAATDAKDSAGIFAAYDNYATYIAWHSSFWRRRAGDLYKIKSLPAALAAIEIAVAVAPDDKDIAHARDLIAASIKKP